MMKRFNLNQVYQLSKNVNIVLISSYDENVSNMLIETILNQRQIELIEKIPLNNQEDWSGLEQKTQNYSLFSEPKAYIMTLEKNALSTKHFPTLTPLDDDLFILKTTFFKHVFFNHLEQIKNSEWLGIYKPSSNDLWHWLKRSFQNKSYTLSNDCNDWFKKQDGIDFATCTQLFEKICLQYPKPMPIENHMLDSHMSYQNEENLQALIDAWMQQEATKTLELLNKAKAQLKDLSLFIWLINRTLQVWYAQSEHKQKPQEIFQQFKVWPKQIPLFESSFKRQDRKKIEHMLLLLQKADEYYKAHQLFLAWITIERLFICQLSNDQ
jgi:DNA polymerase III delta subunit